jgi:hypothetical protein
MSHENPVALQRHQLAIVQVALFGYAVKWASCLQSVHAYASRHGYGYRIVAEPPPSVRAADDADWHKLELARDALRSGTAVLLVDADVRAAGDAPAFPAVAEGVLLARGHSGRFNAGVIYAAGPSGLRFVESVLAARGRKLSRRDWVSWGMNGYVIAAARGNPAVRELAREWNNAVDPALADHFRHYTGPMRRRRDGAAG